MHHLMMEFYSLDDVGQSYDIAQREDRVAVKFGRHPNDFMTSFYMRTPSEFLIEHGWGGRDVSPGWQPVELKSVGSFWGHQGLFESLGEGPPPPDAPPMPAPEPNHAPLQVIDGNYERMSGVCPWWDAVKRSTQLALYGLLEPRASTLVAPWATMTSGVSVTKSAACLRISSTLFVAHRTSIRTLRPMLQPSCCSSCIKAPTRA